MVEQSKGGTLEKHRNASGRIEDRRNTRYDLPIEIEVSGIDGNGEVFHEPTCTRNVSQWGCAFLLSIELKVDDIVSLRVASPVTGKFAKERQSMFQVLRVEREGEGWLVGTWKMDDGDVWGVDLEKMARHREETQPSRREQPTKHGPRPRKAADR